MSEVWINDVDLADYGFVLGADPLHANGPDYSDASAPVLGGIGQSWLAEPTQIASRKLVVSGNLRAASAAQYRAFVDYVKALAANGAVRVRFADRPDQEFRDGRLTTSTATPKTAILGNLAGDVALSFDFADPLRYDVNPKGLGLSTSRVSLPTGTMPCFPSITINGGGSSLTNPSWTYRNAAGDPQQTQGFTGVLGGNDYLIIEGRRIYITKSVAGTQSDARSWWTSGDFLVIRPADGSYELSQFPTIELSASAGTPYGSISYTRPWQ